MLIYSTEGFYILTFLIFEKKTSSKLTFSTINLELVFMDYILATPDSLAALLTACATLSATVLSKAFGNI